VKARHILGERMRVIHIHCLGVPLLLAAFATATIFGSVRGIVHDPQHRPVQGAMVMLKATSSEWSTTTNTDANGEFPFTSVPLGDYSISVSTPGFAQEVHKVVVNSGSVPVVHFQLKVDVSNETVTVSGAPETAATESVASTTLVSRQQIAQTPSADQT